MITAAFMYPRGRSLAATGPQRRSSLAVDIQASETRSDVVASALLAGVNSLAAHAVLSLDDAHGRFADAPTAAVPPPSERWYHLLERFASHPADTAPSPVGPGGQIDEPTGQFARGLLVAAAAFLAAEANDLEDRIAVLPADQRWEQTRAHLAAIARTADEAADALMDRLEEGTWREFLEITPPASADLVTLSGRDVPAGTTRDHPVTLWSPATSGALMPSSTPRHGECPYPGLAAFNADQAQWFFGRDQLIRDLIARLDDRLLMGGVQMVMASSGAGKSSLLRAGLLPKLANGALPGSSRWPQMLLTPTADPLTALATQIAALTGDNAATLAEELAADSPPVEAMLHRCIAAEDPAARLVVS